MTSPGAAISSRLRSWIGPAGERGERDCREPAHHGVGRHVDEHRDEPLALERPRAQPSEDGGRGAGAAANERHREHEHTNAAQI
ncbi:MAG: hypothetical protein QOD83_4893 [Solirubrobacteraceae bacterium]|jgi:hypothetical protein|nr:hypothetical protein [Solirubrobacteraceae bacterium]